MSKILTAYFSRAGENYFGGETGDKKNESENDDEKQQ